MPKWVGKEVIVDDGGDIYIGVEGTVISVDLAAGTASVRDVDGDVDHGLKLEWITIKPGQDDGGAESDDDGAAAADGGRGGGGEAAAGGVARVGMRVEALFDDDHTYYGGEIVRDNGDGTFLVRFDDGDEKEDVAEHEMRPGDGYGDGDGDGGAPAATPPEEEEEEEEPPVKEQPKPAAAAAPAAGGDDDDGDDYEDDDDMAFEAEPDASGAAAAAPAAAAPRFGLGQRVEALFEGELYPGTVGAIHDDDALMRNMRGGGGGACTYRVEVEGVCCASRQGSSVSLLTPPESD